MNDIQNDNENGNGNGQRPPLGFLKLDHLGHVLVFAAIAEASDAGEARALLARQGLHVVPKQVLDVQDKFGDEITRLRDSGLSAALVGEGADRAGLLAGARRLCLHLMDRMGREDPPFDREFAAVFQHFTSYLSLLLQQSVPRAAGPAGTAAKDAEGIASALNLLEAMNYEQPPAGSSESDVHDAARRLAAATGHAFLDPGPAELTLA